MAEERIEFAGVELVRKDIPGRFDEEWWTAWNLYRRVKEYGLAFSGGWAEQPAYVVRIVELIEGLMAKR